MKRVLFIDRDGTLVKEPPIDLQLDSLEKLEFIPGVFRSLGFIAEKLDFELVLVSNQDGLGTDSFPEKDFYPPHTAMLKALAGEGITFVREHIDRSFEYENKPTRKPGIGMLDAYFSDDYDLPNSYVIGDRITDVALAANLGCRAILLTPTPTQSTAKITEAGLSASCALITSEWETITEFLFAGERRITIKRKTKETDIAIALNIDGNGITHINTGLHFFDHMLEQIGKHAGIDLDITVKGDIEVDEHHTIEDTALALGEAINKALGNKRGIERYGFSLPMDDCLCSVALDFGGRPWLVWKATFTREKVGDMPTEMFLHFFKSFSDAARINLNIQAEGENEHHKIEGIFKALARAIKMAVKRDIYHYHLPSTKGEIF